MKGSIFSKTIEITEAVASFDKAIAIKPDYAEAWYYRGYVLRGFGQNAEALESFDKAIAIKPDYSDAWYNRGYVLKMLGRNTESLQSYVKSGNKFGYKSGYVHEDTIPSQNKISISDIDKMSGIEFEFFLKRTF